MTKLYTPPNPPGKRHRGKLRLTAIFVVLAAIAGGAVLVFGGKSAPKKKEPAMVRIVPVLPPPPPTPPPQPTPPPPEPETSSQEPEFVEEVAAEAAPEQAPDEPAPMGSNIQGDGPPDAFGLRGSGGGGLIGGRGSGGPGGSGYGAYAGRLQGAVAAALRAHPLTRSSRMQIKVRLWVDSSGRVTRAILEGSSGSPSIDNALRREILPGLQLAGPPPEGMPLPIVMRINASRP